MFAVYSAFVSLCVAFTTLHTHVSPGAELTFYERVGLPGYRTYLHSLGPLADWLAFTGLPTMLGVPDAARFREVQLECQNHVDLHATMLHLATYGLVPEPVDRTTFLCRRLANRGATVPGRVSNLALTLTYPLRITSYLPFIIAAAVIFFGFTVATLMWAGYQVFVSRRLVSVSCDRAPYTHREARELFNHALRTKLKYNLSSVTSDPTGHTKLAYIRRKLEAATFDVLGRMGSKIRDIGGSVTRNVRLGKALHICFPATDAADRIRTTTNPTFQNDVQQHRGEDCPLSSRPSTMIYVDFHLPLGALVRAIRAPTLIVTHDFSQLIGEEEWFDGEARVTRYGDFISMTTRGGTTYTHGFHSWGQEGTVVTSDGAFSYQRIFDEDKSIVLWCCPLHGEFDPHKDNTLVSSAGHNSVFEMNNGATAVLDGEHYLFTAPGLAPTKVAARTLYRVAFQMSLAVRDAKWLPNLNSLLRGRFTADKQPEIALAMCQELTVMLADQMSVCFRSSAIEDPASLGIIKRICARLFLRATQHMPHPVVGVLTRLARYTRAAVFTRGPRFAPTSWTWSHVSLPTYEVFWSQVCTSRLDAQQKLKQPFRDPGAAVAASPALQPRSSPGLNRRQPGGRNREASAGSGTQTTPQPRSTNRGTPAVPDGTTRHATRDPAHLPATTPCNAARVVVSRPRYSKKTKSARTRTSLARSSVSERSPRQHGVRSGAPANQRGQSTHQPSAAHHPAASRNRFLEPSREPMAPTAVADAVRAVGAALHARPSTAAKRRPGMGGTTRTTAQ